MSKHLLQLLFKRSWKESDELPQNHDHAISVYPSCDCSQWALSPTSLLTSFQSMWYCVDSVVECTMSMYHYLSVSPSNTCHQWTWAIIYSEGIINEHMSLFTLKVLSEIIPCLLHCYVTACEKYTFQDFPAEKYFNILTGWKSWATWIPQFFHWTPSVVWASPICCLWATLSPLTGKAAHLMLGTPIMVQKSANTSSSTRFILSLRWRRSSPRSDIIRSSSSILG